MEYKPSKCATCGAATSGCWSCKPTKVATRDDEEDSPGDDYGDGRGSKSYSNKRDKGQGITGMAKIEGPHTNDGCGYSDSNG